MHKTNLPSLQNFKTHAKLFRAVIGKELQYGKALILLSHQYGYSDWNILKPLLGKKETGIAKENLLDHTIQAIHKYKSSHSVKITEDTLMTEFRKKHSGLWYRYLKKSLLEKATDNMPLLIEDADGNTYQVTDKNVFFQNTEKFEEYFKNHDFEELEKCGIKRFLIDNEENQEQKMEIMRSGRFDPERYFWLDQDIGQKEKIQHWIELEKTSKETSRLASENIIVDISGMNKEEAVEKMAEELLERKGIILDKKLDIPVAARELRKNNIIVMYAPSPDTHKNISFGDTAENFTRMFRHFRKMNSKKIQMMQKIEDIDPKYYNFPSLKKGDGFMMIDSKANLKDAKRFSHPEKKKIPEYVKQFKVDKKPSK